MSERKANKGKKAKYQVLSFNQVLNDMLVAPQRLEEAMCLIADLLHRQGGDVTLNVFDGRKVRDEYTLGLERSADNPELIRLRLYARPADDSRPAKRKDRTEHSTGPDA
jgi:hypothetical protein